MNFNDHLTDDLLLRDLDEELSPAEAAAVDTHLAGCGACKQRYHDWSALSIRVTSLLDTVSSGVPRDHREALDRSLWAEERLAVNRSPAHDVLYRFGWAVGLAAALIIGLLLWPHIRTDHHATAPKSTATVNTAQDFADTFELNGETFTPLPYSNPDLPLSGAHIVRMRVPTASLAAAGVQFEPISYELATLDRSVAADVLFGMDGQPLGVHILNEE